MLKELTTAVEGELLFPPGLCLIVGELLLPVLCLIVEELLLPVLCLMLGELFTPTE